MLNRCVTTVLKRRAISILMPEKKLRRFIAQHLYLIGNGLLIRHFCVL